jgi:mono/diheme cytochrome c family protein
MMGALSGEGNRPVHSGPMIRKLSWLVLGVVGVLAGCVFAARAPERAPLGAYLTPAAATGAPVALRVDPDARVAAADASHLPPASYAPAQAERGRAIYQGRCSACHPPAQFVGAAFVESWNDRRVWDFWALVRSTMPLDAPGALPEQDYVDLVAYLLQANQAEAGSELAVDAEALRALRIAVRAPTDSP